MLALGLGAFTGGSGAMAQSTNNGWNALLSQTQYNTTSWTGLTTGATIEGKTVHASAGMTLGTGSTTTPSYYYLMESLDLTNTTAGGSGLTISGTVYLYIPNGLTLSCQGASASGATGAGAGIELAAGNTLYIIGGAGTVTATGGNAANGGNGAAGTDAGYSYNSWTSTGAGGKGGDGGGGAGAGIGTRGGNGGTGGAGGAGETYTNWHQNPGTNGSNGGNGATAGAMGTLYVANGITVTATGGATGTSGGAGGQRGQAAIDDDVSWNYTMAGGGGGGGGAYGGAAANIGTGGPGGGGGGGGAGGAMEADDYNLTKVYAAGAYGAYNLDGSRAGDGADGDCNGWSLNNGWAKQNSDFDGDDFTEEGDVAMGSAGSYGANGSAASAGTQHATDNDHNLWYTITYHWAVPSVTTTTVKYSPSTGASVVLPQNTLDGYQWALGTYGKDCHVSGDASEFTTASKEFYGGNFAGTANRTIYLKDVYGDLDFYEVKSVCMLENSSDNSQEIDDFFVPDNNPGSTVPKWPITVRLKDRTLYKDDHWNTICLPFNMTEAQVDASPLSGATIKKLNTSVSGYYPSGNVNKPGYQVFDYGYPVVLFWFDDVNLTTEDLQAGKPYLVKWASGTKLVDNTTEVAEAETDYASDPSVVVPALKHQLDFNYVTVKKQSTGAGSWVGVGTTDGTATFQGTFSSTDLDNGDKKKLILGADDKLYHPSHSSLAKISLPACRGYFIIPVTVAANARKVVMSFDNGATTDIQTLNFTPENLGDAPIYNLSGQRLSAPKKGINIVNGKVKLVK